MNKSTKMYKNNEHNEKMNKTNDEIDGCQETVVGLRQTIETVENEVS